MARDGDLGGTGFTGHAEASLIRPLGLSVLGGFNHHGFYLGGRLIRKNFFPRLPGDILLPAVFFQFGHNVGGDYPSSVGNYRSRFNHLNWGNGNTLTETRRCQIHDTPTTLFP